MMPLSLDQVEHARKSLLCNARELLEESELLLKNGRAARSYALAQLACEELAKIPMLVRAGVFVILGLPVDWQQLKKRMQSHRSKLRQIAVLDYSLFGLSEKDGNLRLLKDELSFVSSYNVFKNCCLYVTYDGDAQTYVQPSSLVERDLAEKFLSICWQRFKCFEEMEGRAYNLKALANDPSAKKRVMDRYEALFKRK